MSNGASWEEETEQRLRWECDRLRGQWEVSVEEAQRWRRMYDEAIRRVAIFHPHLAEITEEDAFRHWEMDVR